MAHACHWNPITAVIAQWPSAPVGNNQNRLVTLFGNDPTRCYYTSKTSPPPTRTLSWNCAGLSMFVNGTLLLYLRNLSYENFESKLCRIIDFPPGFFIHLGNVVPRSPYFRIGVVCNMQPVCREFRMIKHSRNEHDPRLALITHRSFAPQIPQSWILMLWNHALRVSIMDGSD